MARRKQKVITNLKESIYFFKVTLQTWNQEGTFLSLAGQLTLTKPNLFFSYTKTTPPRKYLTSGHIYCHPYTCCVQLSPNNMCALHIKIRRLLPLYRCRYIASHCVHHMRMRVHIKYFHFWGRIRDQQPLADLALSLSLSHICFSLPVCPACALSRWQCRGCRQSNFLCRASADNLK